MDTVSGIASASMNVSAMQLETAYSTAILKKSMDNMEQQAMSLIDQMAQTVTIPATSQGHLDLYI